MHVYEVRPRKDHRGVDLISLPLGQQTTDFQDKRPAPQRRALAPEFLRFGPRFCQAAARLARFFGGGAR
jgi:hypothetical protein